jgi:hypothetical protein
MSFSPFDLKVYRIRQIRFSLFILALVVWGWGFLILNALEGIGMAPTFLLPVVLALPLLVISILFARRTHGLSGSFLFQSKRALWLYLLVVAITVLGYVLARMISIALHRPEFVVPTATILIGLHFLCFVPLFHSKGYYLTTAVFCLTAVVSVLVVPLTFTIGSLQVVNGWQFVNGCACVLWLWMVAIRHVIIGTALRHRLQYGLASCR